MHDVTNCQHFIGIWRTEIIMNLTNYLVSHFNPAYEQSRIIVSIWWPCSFLIDSFCWLQLSINSWRRLDLPFAVDWSWNTFSVGIRIIWPIDNPVKNLSSQVTHWVGSFRGDSVTSQWTHKMTKIERLLWAFCEFAAPMVSLLWAIF